MQSSTCVTYVQTLLFSLIVFVVSPTLANTCGEAYNISAAPHLFKNEYPDFLRKENASKSTTQRLFVRDPQQPIQDENYILNSLAGLRKIFVPWFLDGAKGRFVKMLKDQHKISRVGESGTEPYGGAEQLDQLDDRIYGIDFTRRTGKWSWDGPVLTWQTDFIPKRFRTGLTSSPKEIHWKLKLAGIPRRFGPDHMAILTNKELIKWHYEFLPAEHVPSYLKAMEKIMAEIRKDVMAKRNLVRILERLSDYHQLFAVGHPFHRINNSIAMGQINFILEYMGLSGISHGEIDYTAHAQDYQIYRKTFIGMVLEQNPQLKAGF